MYGWRCRIGVIFPSANTVVENEFPRLAPSGVSVHAARLPVVRNRRTHTEELLEMAESKDLEHCAKSLRDARVDVVVYACTSGSFLGEADHGDQVERRISAVTGVPAVTTARAVLDAMGYLEWKRVAVVTPYEPAIHEATQAYLQKNGFDVVRLVGFEALPTARNQPKSDLGPEVSYILGRKALMGGGDVDGLFISCTAFRTFETLPTLSRDFEVPVISANQASVWAALREAGLATDIHRLVGDG